ncbi:MAG: RsmD family RNA methyltransferase, partial [Clostridia bacterium]|nr:RsmD family RNA methyltransferase [Clostridia bacterium]
ALEKFEIAFDLILIDPPYKSEYYEKALEIIFKNNLLSKDGIIVLEHDKSKIIKTDNFEIISQKNYGKRVLTYLVAKN